MKFKPMPSLEVLKAKVTYDPETGHFISRHSGRRIGFYMEKGYRRVGIDGVCHGEHRLAWLYMTGAPPPEFIDHINGVRDDNRWANLRPATMSQNCFNSRKRRGCASELKGVRAYYKKWQAYIRSDGKSKSLGVFESEEAAHAAYVSAAKAVAGEFARAA